MAASLLMSHVRTGRYPLMSHADWFGLTALDLVFPSLLLLFGVGLGLAGSQRTPWRRWLRRFGLLVTAGLVFNAITNWSLDLATWRVTGVLQRFAIVGLVVALVTWKPRTPLTIATIAMAVLIAYQVLLVFTAAGCPGGVPQPDCNPLGALDLRLLPVAHVYAGGSAGFDPEGPSSTLGAIGTGLLGYAAGAILRERTRSGAALLALAAACAISGLVFAQFMPISKRLWTPSFATVTAAVVILALAALHQLVDNRGLAVPLRPLEAVGRNSLVIYVGKYALFAVLTHVGIAGSPVFDQLQDLAMKHSAVGDLLLAATFAVAWLLVAIALHRHRLYLRL